VQIVCKDRRNPAESTGLGPTVDTTDVRKREIRVWPSRHGKAGVVGSIATRGSNGRHAG